MGKILHARLDAESQRILKSLCRRTGWRGSEIVRRGIRALAACTPAATAKRVIGLGKFRSGVSDLGSHKGHLKNFGR